jgi:hypothetical protein
MLFQEPELVSEISAYFHSPDSGMIRRGELCVGASESCSVSAMTGRESKALDTQKQKMIAATLGKLRGIRFKKLVGKVLESSDALDFSDTHTRR